MPHHGAFTPCISLHASLPPLQPLALGFSPAAGHTWVGQVLGVNALPSPRSCCQPGAGGSWWPKHPCHSFFVGIAPKSTFYTGSQACSEEEAPLATP